MIEDNIHLASLKKIYKNFLDNLDGQLNDINRPVAEISKKTHILDEVLNETGTNDLTILASERTGGKTSMALSIASKVKTKEGESIMFFSYFDTNIDFAEKLIAVQLDIDIHLIKQAELTDKEWCDMSKVIRNINHNNIYFQNFSVLHPDSVSIAMSSLEVTQKTKVLAIFIDSLNDLEPNEGEIRKSLAIQLADLANELEVPIFATTKLSNKRIDRRHNKRPIYTDMINFKYIKAATSTVLSSFNPALYNEFVMQSDSTKVLNNFLEISHMKPSPFDE